jgi:steroid 5-alpha reductase family enzyme
MHSLLAPLLPVWLVAAVVMTAVWWIQRRTGNAGYVDVAWAALLGAAALYYGVVADGALLPRLLVAVLAATWGFRLALHLLHRVLNEAEDGRYAHLRQHWDGHQGKFFGFFQAQALAVVLFSLPFLVAAGNPVEHITLWTVLGALIWIVSLGGESVADLQLARFRADPRNRGKTCRAGLWRYSRHPNYFFEWLHWFAYVLLAIGSTYAWLALIGPALMLVSLCWVSGIPFVEAQALRSRGEDYREYQRTTSALVPWPPRSGKMEKGKWKKGEPQAPP